MAGFLSDTIRYGVVRSLRAAAHDVRLISDIPEKQCRLGRHPNLSSKRHRRLDMVRARGVLFIHVPKNAGTSISQQLYGEQIKHASVRYYRTVGGDLMDRVKSFCILRDPIDRFLSAYRYAIDAGTKDNRISPPFFSDYTGFRHVGDAIDHVAGARDMFRIDHIFRPQVWYVTTELGSIGVDHVVHYDALGDLAAIDPALRGADRVRLNASRDIPILLTRAQREEIMRVYARDYELIERAKRLWPGALRDRLRQGEA
ncbi:sulfotransferase family 2 domain-containing protein [Sphingomonas crocodyli]|uniref:Sulfotransferase n=1 Tax=Sphingomonas crocodyli TaxID=1979270 RepID=A0A437M9G2_9SPHN|nr:sulfotransferase family 2 domain-containing protein [Sphingomonas crocodyli]RVT94341.1 sulfotransferase [Sphingomonas crocodyli]